MFVELLSQIFQFHTDDILGKKKQEESIMCEAQQKLSSK